MEGHRQLRQTRRRIINGRGGGMFLPRPGWGINIKKLTNFFDSVILKERNRDEKLSIHISFHDESPASHHV
jgi:hypothetical protein